MMQRMSHETQSGISTFALSVLVAVGVIALLACAEYAIPRWLHSGPGDSGSFFSSNSSAPSAAASRPGAANKTGLIRVLLRSTMIARSAKKHIPARKSSADGGANSPASAPSDTQVSSESQDAAQPSRSRLKKSAPLKKSVRATEDATAHLVALEREERDRLLDRARAMKDRIEAAQRQQPVPREDLAFSQQRFQNDLNQADAALKTADVQKAKIYLDLAKGELEAIAKLLGR